MSKYIDIIGQRFERLLVLSRVENDKSNNAQYLCRCDCGNVKIARGSALRKGYVKSCGCLRKEQTNKLITMNTQDWSGQKVNALYVIKRADHTKSGIIRYLCQCDCGKEVLVCASSLRKGQKSCGCMTKSILQKSHTIHGKCYTRLYGVWDGMLDRCYKIYSVSYKYYGGRGITVCDEWRTDFQAFYDWAMANGYNPEAKRGECTLDRIDVNGNYCPENCRWVDMKTQEANKHRDENGKKIMNRKRDITIKGETKSLKEWCGIYNITPASVRYRMSLGWDKIKAITEPKIQGKCGMISKR